MRFILRALTQHILAVFLTAGCAVAEGLTPVLSTTQLEERLVEIDAELGGLANYSWRSGHGTFGWRSRTFDDPDHAEWIQIELGEEMPIDQIVLVPAILRGAESAYQAEGFPLEFRVIVGNTDDLDGTVVGGGGAKDALLPRYAPVIIRFPRTAASWIRVEATQLSPRSWDGKYLFQLAEIMVFSGQENVALHRTVRTARASRGPGLSVKEEFLVDGFMPYLMDAAQGDQSGAFLAGCRIDDKPYFIIDLGSVQLLDRIQLHAMDMSDKVPQEFPSDLGIPEWLRVEGANQSDFSDTTHLLDYKKETIYDTGPIIARRFPETACRYVKLTAFEPFVLFRGGEHQNMERAARIGFAEIELFSGDQNVALDCPVLASVPESPDRHLSALTDGRNQFGDILPIRDWMEELSRRHELERERPQIAQELNRQYLRQKTNLSRAIWLAALLSGGIVVTILVERIIRMRQAGRIRERLAADLHDELGANIYTIGLLGEVALNSMNSPERLHDVLQRKQEVIKRTGAAIRHCINQQETHGYPGSLHQDMKRIAHRILADLDYEIVVEGEEFLEKIKADTRDDLRLFYKECLVNVSRHADATEVITRLESDRKMLRLTVSDNGRGMSEAGGRDMPSSLQRRGRFLGAKVFTTPSESGGTCVTLILKWPWMHRMRWGRARKSRGSTGQTPNNWPS